MAGRQRIRWIQFGLVAAIVIALVGSVWLVTGRRSAGPSVVEGSGQIEGTEVVVGTKIAGRITWLPVNEGGPVASGQVLVRLSADDLRADVRQADAQVLVARAQTLQAEAGAGAAQQQVLQAETNRALAREDTDSRIAQAAAALAEAEARLAGARAQAQQARAAMHTAQDTLLGAQADLTKTRKDLDRLSQLYAQGAVAAADVDAAQAAYEGALARHHGAESQVAGTAAGVVQADQEITAALAAVARAQAAVTQARTGTLLVILRDQEAAAARAQSAQARALAQAARERFGAARAARDRAAAAYSDATITAPGSGVVLRKLAHEGEVVAAGTPILTLVDVAQLWLKIYVNEVDLGRLRLGDRASVAVDAFPGRGFKAVVSEIGKQAEFTPRAVQMKDERTRLVYGVKLRLLDPAGYLKPGMPADGRVYLQTDAADAAAR
jgi:HlyD family secretion protein